MQTLTGFDKLDELRMKAASSPTGVIKVSIEELNEIALEVVAAKQNTQRTELAVTPLYKGV